MSLMQPDTPPTLSAFLSGLLARFLSSWTGKAVTAVFIALQIYLFAIVPAWQQAATLPGAWAKLENAEREADAARQLQTGLANQIAEDAKLKRAEADAILEKARAEAEAKEAEADRAGAESIAAPELEKAIAEEAAARAKVLTATATAAREQAKATADGAEAGARKTKADLQASQALLIPQINEKRSAARAAQDIVVSLLGRPLPEIFSFDSDK